MAPAPAGNESSGENDAVSAAQEEEQLLQAAPAVQAGQAVHVSQDHREAEEQAPVQAAAANQQGSPHAVLLGKQTH